MTNINYDTNFSPLKFETTERDKNGASIKGQSGEFIHFDTRTAMHCRTLVKLASDGVLPQSERLLYRQKCSIHERQIIVCCTITFQAGKNPKRIYRSELLNFPLILFYFDKNNEHFYTKIFVKTPP